MKKLLLIQLFIISSIILGQSKMYVHTATTDNIVGWSTRLDHPDLNGNPNAAILIAHSWNGDGAPGVYNDNVSGVHYDGSVWWIYNEDTYDLVVGSKYNVFIGDPDNLFIHQITHDNLIDDYSTILPEGYADEILFFTNKYNVYNNHRFSWDLVGERRYLYNPEFTLIPINAQFHVYEPMTELLYTHVTTSATIVNNYTLIDHPQLNNNPNATFLFCHFYGLNGEDTEVNINKNLGVWYNGSRWSIYTEDQSPMPVGLVFDILIADNEMSTNDPVSEMKFTVYPNPVVNVLNVDADFPIEKIEIMDLTGQILKKSSDVTSIDMSDLPKGVYIVHVSSANSKSSKKVIKK